MLKRLSMMNQSKFINQLLEMGNNELLIENLSGQFINEMLEIH